MSTAMGLPPLPPIRELGETRPFPEPGCTTYVSHNGRRHYRALNGEFEGDLPGVTSVCKLVGLGTEGLIKWSANLERSAVLLAAQEVYKSGLQFEDFAGAVEAKLGPARQHQRALEKAADIGTLAHQAIHDYLNGQMPLLPGESGMVFEAWRKWWDGSGLKPIRMEQPVWDAELGYAGTIDLIAQAPDGQLEVWDWKSSKAIYEVHHLQVVAYCHAARNWAPVRPGGIVRLPKLKSDPGLEVRQLGHMWNDKRLTEEELMRAFKGILDVFRVLA